MTIVLKYFLLLFSGMILFTTSGCAVDNEFIAKLPLFEAKSDKIPGLEPPQQRQKQIQLKGRKGASVSDAEKEILVAQLMVEYRTSPDPNMRREAVDAMAKIPHPKRDQYMKEILTDSDPFVRLSALEALGKTYNGTRKELALLLIETSKRDTDKDIRLAAIRLLAHSFPKQPERKNVVKIPDEIETMIVQVLGEALYDKVPAVRYEAMQSLHKITGKDYGNDINRWIQYVQYQKGEAETLPNERSFAEKLPSVQLPMFK
ncbi:MAG: HEAT repeat domain-containing protein [Planctomycetaceae bacterium]|jgi:predicted transcriptional regulator with HTH domain|nr:HEAT repeat domain-containing protein [Planctomycetaceae bacterium]